MTIPAGSAGLRSCKRLKLFLQILHYFLIFLFLSILRWQWRFFFRYRKKEFDLKDLPKPRAKDEADYVHNEFLGYWEAEVERARKSNRKPNLIYPIFRLYAWTILTMTLFCFASVGFFSLQWMASNKNHSLTNIFLFKSTLRLSLSRSTWPISSRISTT